MSSTALSISKNDDGTITLTATESVQLLQKINVLKAENEQYVKQIDYLQSTLKKERDAYNDLILKMESHNSTQGWDIVSKLTYFTLGAGVYAIIQSF